jgi:hypothetical protein
MRGGRVFILMALSALAMLAFGAESVQAAKHVKSKSYTYCDHEKNGTQSVCFTGPFVVFKKTQTWRFEEPEEVSGTFTVSGKSYVFRETRPEQRDELRGTKGKGGVISGTLYENGQPSEFTFTLTPR